MCAARATAEQVSRITTVSTAKSSFLVSKWIVSVVRNRATPSRVCARAADDPTGLVTASKGPAPPPVSASRPGVSTPRLAAGRRSLSGEHAVSNERARLGAQNQVPHNAQHHPYDKARPSEEAAAES